MPENVENLDLRGLKCPLPVLKADKAMRMLNDGDCLAIETTDPLAAIDIPTYCREKGHTLLEATEAEGFTRFLLKKGTAM